jgi:hypothetical protein
LQDLFDNFRLAQQIVGRKVISMMQSNWDEAKVARITDQAIPQEFFNSSTVRYDVAVEESLETPTQKALAYTQLMQARQAGIPIPDSVLIDYMPLTDKSGLKEAMEAQAEQQAMAQQKQEQQELLAMELANSQKEENLAIAQARRARVLGEMGLYQERISEASENRAQAALARAKTLTEIAEMEENRLMRVVEFVNQLEQQEKASQEEKLQQTIQLATALNATTEGTAENEAMQQVMQPQQPPQM